MIHFNKILGIGFTFLLISTSTISQAASFPQGLKETLLAVKANKYGSLNSLSALRRLDKTVNGPVQILDIAKTPQVIYRQRFLGEFPPPAVSPGVVDNRPGFLDKVAEGVDKTNKIQVLPLIRKGEGFDRGLTTNEKKEVVASLEAMVSLYNSPDVSDAEKTLIFSVLEGYFNVNADKGIQKDDPDFAEINHLADQLWKTEETLLNGQANILEEMDKNTDKVIEQISEENAKMLSDVSNHIEKKAEAVINSVEEEAAAQKAMAEEGFKAILDGQDRIENRLSLIRDRLIATDIQKEIYSIRDPEKLEKLEVEATQCTEKEGRCRVLKAKKKAITQRKDDLTFEIRLQTTKNVASILADIGHITNNPRLGEAADTLGKVAYVAETVSKMNDFLSSALVSGGLAAMGDVTSMISLGTSLISAFGSSGPSPEQLILEQLAKIQEQIEDLRQEMHERFDALEQQIAELGISMDNQFQNINANQIVLAKNQELIMDLIAANGVKISEVSQILREQNVEEQLVELQRLAYKIQDRSDFDSIADAYFDIGGAFSAFLTLQPVMKVEWTDSSAETSGDVMELVNFVESRTVQAELTQLQWFDLLSKIADWSARQDAESLCGRVDNKVISLFQAFAYPLSEALNAEFDNYVEVGAVSPSKFQHFLATGPIESSFVDRITGTVKSYAESAGNLQNCLQSYSSKQAGQSQDFVSYLIESYQQKLNQYLGAIGGIFSKDSELTTALLRALEMPGNSLFNVFKDNFQSFNSDRLDLRKYLRIDLIENYNNFEELKQNKPFDALVAELVPSVPDCAVENSKRPPIKVPPKMLKAIFPKYETWLSFYLGLNEIEFCYSPAGDPQVPGGHVTHFRVFSLLYRFKDFEKKAHAVDPNAHFQTYYLPRDIVPGTEYTKQEDILIMDPNVLTELTKKVNMRYLKIDHQKLIADFIENGRLVDYQPVCYTHKGAVQMCWPADHAEKHKMYQDGFIQNKAQGMAQDRFISLKGDEAEKSFNRFAVTDENLKTYFSEMKAMLDGCRKNIILDGVGCTFDKAEALTTKGSEVRALANDLLKLNWLIRMSAETYYTQSEGISEAESKSFMDNFRLLMMSPSDVVQLVAFNSDAKSFTDSLNKTSADLNEGFAYLQDEWPKHRQVDLSWLTQTEEYLTLESQILRDQAKIQ